MAQEKSNVIYRVQYKTDTQFYDIFVRHVYPSDMPGFVCLEDFLFREENEVIINPRIEALEKEFSNVETAFIPYHQILRIDQVIKAGESRISEHSQGGKIRQFPMPQ